MFKTEKLQNYMIKYLEKQINRIKNINQPSQIAHIIEDIDSDIIEQFDKYNRSVCNGKYFETDEEYDKFMNKNK